MEDYPKTVNEFENKFSTNEACREYLAKMRWPDGFVCPRCGKNQSWVMKNGRILCSHCRHRQYLLQETVFPIDAVCRGNAPGDIQRNQKAQPVESGCIKWIPSKIFWIGLDVAKRNFVAALDFPGGKEFSEKRAVTDLASIDLTSQNISRLLKRVDESARTQFLAAWVARFSEKEMLCYDITSVSSYAQAMDFVRYGYNRDHEKLPQINLAMLYGRESRLPVHYRRLPGNISDVSTLKKTVQLLDYIGRNRLCFLMDMGFYSQSNLDELYERKYNFLLAAPASRKWIADIIDRQWEVLNSANGYRRDGNGSLYVSTVLEKWNHHRCYVHLFYNEAKRAQENDEFMYRLAAYKEELEKSGLQSERQECYDRFLEISETPKRGLQVAFREEAILSYRERHAGVFVLLSNHIKDPMLALAYYRDKDVVEKSFDDLKNEEDCKRLRMHSDHTADCKLFLSFLALILRSFLANGIRGHEELERLGIPRLLREMNTLREITEEHRYRRVVTEPTRIQKLIIDVFGLNLKGA